MQLGLTYSALLHLVMILIFVFGIPYIPSSQPQQDNTILLELIQISSITNVKTAPRKEKKEIEEKKPPADENKQDNKNNTLKESEYDNPNISKKEIISEQKQMVEEKKIVATKKIEEKKAAPKTIDDDAEKLPTKTLKEEKKEPPKEKKNEKTNDEATPKKVEEKPKKATDDKKRVSEIAEKKQHDTKKQNTDDELANSVLKSLQEGGKKASKKTKADSPKNLNDIMDAAIKGETTSDFDADKEMSLSELDAIRTQVSKAWRVTSFSGGEGNKRLRVKAIVTVNKNGEVQDVRIKRDMVGSGASEQLYQAFADSAVRAIQAASPFKNLPPEKYNTWSEMELVFDSEGMIY